MPFTICGGLVESETFDIDECSFGTKFAEQKPLFTHHPYTILCEVEVSYDATGV